MEFKILGPLEVTDSGRPISIGGPKQRALLAILLAQANRVVPTARLIQLLWGEEAPDTARATLQVYVSNLRKVVEPVGKAKGSSEVLVSRPGGYLLVLQPGQLDAQKVEALMDEARQDLVDRKPDRAGERLREALAAWRGPALAEFAAEPFAVAEVARLEEMRLAALEMRIDADLQLGRHAELVSELERLVGEHPLRERLCAQLMLALYRSGRQAEASALYQKTRERLADELGMEPGRELQELLRDVLNQERRLDAPRAEVPESAPGAQHSQRPGRRSVPRSAGPNLPVGTVTFLMTDIEGSTRVWDASPSVAKQALERHDQIIVQAVQKHHGQLVESGREGDSILAVFTQATDAIAGGLAAQRALQREPWPGGVAVRVRVALHSGEAELRAGHYVGAPLYRSARLMAIAHGGQVLVSKATEQLVADSLPEGVLLKDLGRHRLRDLSRPEHVYQLIHPDLAREFPPLNSIEPDDSNLPLQLTSFVGRQSELAALKKLIKDTRLVTLTGPGGIGKSRLAIELAGASAGKWLDSRRLLPGYRGSVRFVDLAPVTNADLVPHEVMATLLVARNSMETTVEAIARFIGDRRLLLILDNCEHVIDEVAALANRLLTSCPVLRIVATSRDPLRTPGETVVSLAGLPVSQATDGKGQPPASVALFRDRARAAGVKVDAPGWDASTVLRICSRLDGLPLAIELAAARSPVLPPAELLSQLDHALALLSRGPRTAATRHQTLSTAIEWSYRLLTDRERLLFERLSVFSGSFDAAAVEAVCTDSSLLAAHVFEAFSGLLDKSMLAPADEDDGRRWRLLEVIRQFAAERLSAVDASAIRKRHAENYLSLAENAALRLRTADQAAWVAKVEVDFDNIRSAFESSIGQDPERTLRAVAGLDGYWFHRRLSEGRFWLTRALETTATGAEARSDALYTLGWLAYFQGDYEETRRSANEVLKISTQSSDPYRWARGQRHLACLSFSEGNLPAAYGFFGECLPVLRSLDATWELAVALNDYALMLHQSGDSDEGRELAEESLGLANRSGDPWVVTMVADSLATVELETGNLDRAEGIWRSLVETSLNNPSETTAYFLEGLARVGLARGEAPQALRLFAAASRMREDNGAQGPKPYRMVIADSIRKAREQLAAHEADELWRQGFESGLAAANTTVL
jgi:predicted ATPase/DNA-binding SARP family transcriptional activator